MSGDAGLAIARFTSPSSTDDVHICSLRSPRATVGHDFETNAPPCVAVALGSTYPFPPPFVWRCLSGSTMAPFPHPAHRTGQADFPHPALGQDFTLSRATPSAASEQFSELIGFPISRSFTTYCVYLELRSLPSTGVTRLPRYYEPLRHPRAPSLSLTGFRLVIADHA